MGRSALGQRTLNGTIDEAAWELIAGAQGCRLVELGVTLAAATASVLALGRPSAIGITPTSPVALQGEEPAVTAALAKGALAWGTKPTVPAAFLRRASLPAAIGASFTWTWASGILIPAAGTLVLWNLASNSVLDVYARIVE